MSGRERRISPRKQCAVPLRFRILENGNAGRAEEISEALESHRVQTFARLQILEGEVLNLSERGIYFRSRERVSIGEGLEICLTLPRELTGRNPEEVRCSARVVHVEAHADQRGLTGVGAEVERFEPVAAERDWSN